MSTTKYVMFTVYDWESRVYRFDTLDALNKQLQAEVDNVAEDGDFDEWDLPELDNWTAVEMFLCENRDDWHHLAVVEV